MPETQSREQQSGTAHSQEETGRIFYHPVFWYGWGIGIMLGGVLAAGKPGWVAWPMFAAGLCGILIAFLIARRIRKMEPDQTTQSKEKPTKNDG